MDFWSIIGNNLLESSSDVDRAIEELGRRLLELSGLEIVQFHDRLCEYLYRLDRRDFAQTLVSIDGQDYPLSDDSFEYARCAVVLSGQETYEKVLQGTVEFREFVDPNKGAESLLYLAAEAYGSKTGRKFKFESEFTTATGSNRLGWG